MWPLLERSLLFSIISRGYVLGSSFNRRGPHLTPLQIVRDRDISWWNWVLLGSFVDSSTFSQGYIQSVVDHNWSSRQRIMVHRMDGNYFFVCANQEDRDDLLSLRHANVDGVLLIFKPWLPGQHPKHVNFKLAPLWVRISGIPPKHVHEEVARRALQMVGNISLVIPPIRVIGPKSFMKGLVLVDLNKPLVPGFYYDYSPSISLWVSLNYEGVFRFCKMCGRVGHNSQACSLTQHQARHVLAKRFAKL